MDPDGDGISVSVYLGSAMIFTQYDPVKRVFAFDSSSLTGKY